MRPGTPALTENALVEMAESYSLFVLSTLEFQNHEGQILIFERNVDERILALIRELEAEDRGERRERLFVWEASPELKKAESMKQLQYFALMLVLLVVAAYMRYYYQTYIQRGQYYFS